MRTVMIGNRICAAALAAAFAIACFTAPANAAPYDGSWKMSLVTTDGHCGVISVALAIRGGGDCLDQRKIRDAPDPHCRPGVRLRPSPDGRCGRPAQGRRQWTVHALQGQRQVERRWTLGRLLGLLDRRPRLTPVLLRRDGDPIARADARGSNAVPLAFALG